MSQPAVDSGRPRSVTIAALLMMVVAAGYLADAVWVVAGAGAYPDRVRQAMSAADVDTRALDAAGTLTAALPYTAALITGIAALVLLGLAVSVRAGHAPGRIVAWVAIGLALSCGFCSLGQAGTPAFSGVTYVTASSRDAAGLHTFSERLPATYPPLYRYVTGGFALFAMLALIAVAVLLARPSANRFFRPDSGWSPTGQPRPGPAPAGWTPVYYGLTPQQNHQLSMLDASWHRGELTEAQFAEARRRVLGGP